MGCVGRKRETNLGLPLGVRERAGVWYWQPPTKKEREERKANREKTGEPIGCTLGPANSKEARQKWAEVSGYRDPAEISGTVAELIDLWKKEGLTKTPKGIPRADSTVVRYKSCCVVLKERFGQAKYGKTDFEASRGRAIGTADVQGYIAEHQFPAKANQLFAVLDNIFRHAVRKGKTTYNPCAAVVTNEGGVREREPLPWEVEALRALASARMGLMMDFEAITGWRISDILALTRGQGTADGIRVRYKKVGKRWLWEWTPESRRIWAEAESLPFASKFPASPVFPSRGGRPMTYAGFFQEWTKLRAQTNVELAAGILDPETHKASGRIEIVDLHFHDLRSKAHDDAEEAGRAGNEVLGNTPGIARRHYDRREKKTRFLK